jgi:Zn-dependent peptidase ImmA (M78 family)/transcriptional regulator with XRE-family HTH domain
MNANISKNLLRLRIINDYTQEKVADAVGISRPNYINLEHGSSSPRISTLQSIARFYKIKIDEILMEDVSSNTIRFRCKKLDSDKKKTQREIILNQFCSARDDYNSLQEILNNRMNYKFSNDNFEDPKQAASYVRDILKLKDDEPIHDICGVMENIGVNLIFLEASLEEFFGLSEYSDNLPPTIGINHSKDISIERKIFTIAHEFGHILLHKNSFRSDEKLEIQREEKEADEFASYLLLPQEGFDKEWKKRIGFLFIDRVIQIKRIFKVSYMTILTRLNQNKKIKYNPFAVFKKNYTQKLSKKSEPEGLTEYDFSEERFPRLVQEAVLQDKISLSRGSELLNLSNSEMRKLVNEWYMEL